MPVYRAGIFFPVIDKYDPIHKNHYMKSALQSKRAFDQELDKVCRRKEISVAIAVSRRAVTQNQGIRHEKDRIS